MTDDLKLLTAIGALFFVSLGGFVWSVTQLSQGCGL